jgi:hypothetical protein
MRCVLALLLTLALGVSGCAALVGGAAAVGGYKYVQGQYETNYRHPYDQVYDATLASLQENNMPVTSTEKDVAGAKIKAKRADGTDVWLDLKKTGPETTDATIRVGRMGDENASQAIANSIATKLGEAEREPTGRGGE